LSDSSRFLFGLLLSSFLFVSDVLFDFCFLSLTHLSVFNVRVNLLREFFNQIEFGKLFKHFVNLRLLGSAQLAKLSELVDLQGTLLLQLLKFVSSNSSLLLDLGEEVNETLSIVLQ
jgi:hypothetical protein